MTSVDANMVTNSTLRAVPHLQWLAPPPFPAAEPHLVYDATGKRTEAHLAYKALKHKFAGETNIAVGDVKSSLGDAESSMGDAKSSMGGAKSSLGDAESSLGDAKSSLGDAKSSLGDAKSSLGDAKS
jgi:uncharacterized protein YjbJ (UPF0337 family)